MASKHPRVIFIQTVFDNPDCGLFIYPDMDTHSMPRKIPEGQSINMYCLAISKTKDDHWFGLTYNCEYIFFDKSQIA